MYTSILSEFLSPTPETTENQPRPILGLFHDTPEGAQQEASNRLAMAWVDCIAKADSNVRNAYGTRVGGPYWLDTQMDTFSYMDSNGLCHTLHAYAARVERV